MCPSVLLCAVVEHAHRRKKLSSSSSGSCSADDGGDVSLKPYQRDFLAFAMERKVGGWTWGVTASSLKTS